MDHRPRDVARAVRRAARRLVGVAVAVAAGLLAAPGHAQDDASRAAALIRDLGDPDFERANAAAEQLRKHPEPRAQVVAGLIEAITTRDWNRCAGDMRDTIARMLGERALDAKYGRGEFDLRETLQEAIAAATTGRP